MYIFVDFHQSVHKRFQIFYPEHIFYPKFKKKKRLTELSKLMTETQTDSVYRLRANVNTYPFLCGLSLAQYILNDVYTTQPKGHTHMGILLA